MVTSVTQVNVFRHQFNIMTINSVIKTSISQVFNSPILVSYLQKTATAVAYCKRGCGLIRVNGRPLDQIEPKVLQYKLQEPILLLGKVKLQL